MQKKSIFKIGSIATGNNSKQLSANQLSEPAEEIKHAKIFFDLSYKFHEGEGVLKPALFKQIIPEAEPETESSKKLEMWHRQMDFMYLYNLNYSYRAKTEAIFKSRENLYFDFFFVDDAIFDQHYLFKNLWRETLLL